MGLSWKKVILCLFGLFQRLFVLIVSTVNQMWSKHVHAVLMQYNSIIPVFNFINAIIQALTLIITYLVMKTWSLQGLYCKPANQWILHLLNLQITRLLNIASPLSQTPQCSSVIWETSFRFSVNPGLNERPTLAWRMSTLIYESEFYPVFRIKDAAELGLCFKLRGFSVQVRCCQILWRPPFSLSLNCLSWSPVADWQLLCSSKKSTF